MKKNYFINSKVLFIEFYLNYKMLLGVFIFCSFYAMVFIFPNLTKPFYIAPTNFTNNGKTFYSEGILKATFRFTNPVISVISTTIIALILININIGKEFTSGKLRLWLTTSYSKEQVFCAKILFIWTVIIATCLTQFICQLILSAISADFNKYIGLVIFKNISFLVFKLTITSIILLISSVFVERSEIAMAINILFIIFLFFISIADSIFDLDGKYSWVKYLLLDNLSNADCLNFTPPTTPTKNGTLFIGQLIKTKAWLKALTFIINCLLIGGLSYASIKILKTKDANCC